MAVKDREEVAESNIATVVVAAAVVATSYSGEISTSDALRPIQTQSRGETLTADGSLRECHRAKSRTRRISPATLPR